MLGCGLTGPWVHQLILQPPTPVLQVWLPVFEVCHDTVECNLGSECCEKSCLPKGQEKPAGASPGPSGAMAQSCPCPQSSCGVCCQAVCAWLWLILTWLPGFASDLALHPCGLTALLAVCGHCHQTCSALLAWSLCLCAPLAEVPAVLTASPALLCSSGSPSSSAAAALPSSRHGPQPLRVPETPAGDGRWYERLLQWQEGRCGISFASLQLAEKPKRNSGLSARARRAAGRRSSLDTPLDRSQALTDAFQGHRFTSPFLGLCCRQTTNSTRQRKLRGIATEQPQWFILNLF